MCALRQPGTLFSWFFGMLGVDFGYRGTQPAGAGPICLEYWIGH